MIMIQLTVIFLMLIFRVLGQPTSMWPTDCHNIQQQFPNYPATLQSNTRYESFGCNFRGYIKIDLTNVPTNFTASIIVTRGTVVDGGNYGIGILYPSADNIKNNIIGSLNITISNMTFGRNAILTFSGALPPRSNVLLSNNTFDITTRNPNSGTPLSESIMVTIMIDLIVDGYNNNPMVLHTSSLIITNNKIVATSGPTTTNVLNAIYVTSPSSALKLENSKIIITGNSLIHSNSGGSNASTFTLLCIEVPNGNVTITNSSTIALDNNLVWDSKFFKVSVLAVMWKFPEGTFITMSVTDSSLVTMSHNMMENVSVQGSLKVVSLGLVNGVLLLKNESSVVINNNAVVASTSSSTTDQSLVAVNFGVSSLAITDKSSLAISGNNILNTTVPFDLIVVNWFISDNSNSPNVTVANLSHIIVNGNTLRNSLAGRNVVVAWLLLKTNATFSVIDDSFITMNNNTILGTNISGNANAVHWWFEGQDLSFSIIQSAITMAHNNINHSAVGGTVLVTGWVFLRYRDFVATRSVITIINNSISNVAVGQSAEVAVLSFDGTKTKPTVDNTTITMSGNKCSNSTTLGKVALVAWRFINNDAPISISNNSLITISDNHFLGSNATSDVHVIHWYFNTASTTLSVIGSTIQINDNSIARVVLKRGTSNCLAASGNGCVTTNSTIGGHAVVVNWDFYRTITLAMNNNAVIEMKRNQVISAVVGGYLHIVVWSSSSSNIRLTCTLTNSSIKVNDNVAAGNNASSNVMAVHWNFGARPSLSILNGSSIAMNNNSISNSLIGDFTNVVRCYFGSSLGLTIAYNSHFSANNNSLCNSTVATTAHILVMETSHQTSGIYSSLEDGSSIMLSGNICRNTTSNDAIILYWQFGYTYATTSEVVSYNSDIIISNNVAEAVRVAGTYLTLASFSIRNIGFFDGSRFLFHNNEISSCIISSSNTSLLDMTEVTLNASQLFIVGNKFEAYGKFGTKSIIGLRNISFNGVNASVTYERNNFILIYGDAGRCPPETLNITSITSSTASSSLIVAENVLTLRNLDTSGSTVCSLTSFGSTFTTPPGIVAPKITFAKNIVVSTSKLDSFPSYKLLKIFVDEGIIQNLSLSLSICGNSIFGDTSSSFIPDPFLEPSRLSSLVIPCKFTPTVSSAHSATSTTNKIPTPSKNYSSSISSTNSSTPSKNYSSSISSTNSSTPSKNYSSSISSTNSSTPSKNYSSSISSSLSPMSLSVTDSTSPSKWPSSSFTASGSILNSASGLMINGTSQSLLDLTQSKMGSNTSTISVTDTLLVLRDEAEEPLILIPVPPTVTAGITIAATAMGGVVSAVDAQTVAVIGLVACAKKGDSKDKNGQSADFRALSLVGLDATCEGVLIGNTITLIAVAFISAVAVGGARIVLANRRRQSQNVGIDSVIAPTFVNSCAMVRAPHIWFIVCLYLGNSYMVCGLQLAREEGNFSANRISGSIAFAFPLAIVCCLPPITLLFGTRRLLSVRYHWEPKVMRKLGAFVFQTWAQDPTLPPHKMFGCVLAAQRRLGCFWTLLPHASFLATIPMIVASHKDGSCGPLFAVSAALHFFVAGVVLITRPRRVAASDVLHGLVLVANGSVVANATVLLYDSTGSTKRSSIDSTLEWLGVIVNALTVVRAVHTLGTLFLAFLLQKECIGGVEIGDSTSTEEKGDSLGCAPDLSCLVLKDEDLVYSGLLWKMEEVTDLMRVPLVKAYEGIEMVLKSQNESSGTGAEIPVIVDREVEKVPQKPFVPSRSLGSFRLNDDMISERFLTEEQLFRREIAKECAQRHLEEFLMV